MGLEKIIKEVTLRQPLILKEAISKYYPLPIDILKEYCNPWNQKLDIGLVCMNESINWTSDFIDDLSKSCFLNWEILSSNCKLPLNIDFIEKYSDYWDWDWLSMNQGLPWSVDLILKFQNEFGWYNISRNTNIKWTRAIVDKFFYQIDFVELSKNEELYWLEDFVKNKILSITPNLSEFCEENGIEVEKWTWTDSFPFFVSGSNSDKKDWESLSKEIRPDWSEDYIIKRIRFWDWNLLSSNPSLPWSIEFIKKFEKYWNWGWLSANSSIPFNEKLIDEFTDRWSWGSLCSNKNIIWTEQLIEKYKSKIDWHYLSLNESLSWRKEFIELYQDDINWRSICRNKKALSDKDVFVHFFDRVELDSLSTELFYDLFIKDLEIEKIEEVLQNEEEYKEHQLVGYERPESDNYGWGSLYDSEYYNDEVDLDQQGPDFDI